MVADAVLRNLSATAALPGNREKYRERRRKGPFLPFNRPTKPRIFKGLPVGLPGQHNREPNRQKQGAGGLEQRASAEVLSLSPRPFAELRRRREPRGSAQRMLHLMIESFGSISIVYRLINPAAGGSRIEGQRAADVKEGMRKNNSSSRQRTAKSTPRQQSARPRSSRGPAQFPS